MSPHERTPFVSGDNFSDCRKLSQKRPTKVRKSPRTEPERPGIRLLNLLIYMEKLAEGMGFEPTVRLDTVQRFSKPPPSASRPPLQALSQCVAAETTLFFLSRQFQMSRENVSKTSSILLSLRLPRLVPHLLQQCPYGIRILLQKGHVMRVKTGCILGISRMRRHGIGNSERCKTHDKLTGRKSL